MTTQPIEQIPSETLGAMGWDLREQIDGLNAQLQAIRAELTRRNRLRQEEVAAKMAALNAKSAELDVKERELDARKATLAGNHKPD